MEPFQEMKSAKGPSLFLLSEWMRRHERLTVGFSGRSGGVSGPPWASLNIGLHVGDRADDVIQNRKLIAAAIDWPFESWTCAEQVHGSQVGRVTKLERGKGRASHADAIAGCDAIMTNEPDLLLASFYADCVPLYFYDPEHGAVALAHAGWRGTVGQIAAATLRAMGEAYGTNPQQVAAAIGPAIGSCCYEVDGIVIDEVDALIAELQLEDAVAQSLMTRDGNGKARPDLKEINRQIMIKAGILPIHIELTEWCTGCRRDLFYSHRMEGGRTGRMASWIGIRGGDQ